MTKLYVPRPVKGNVIIHYEGNNRIIINSPNSTQNMGAILTLESGEYENSFNHERLKELVAINISNPMFGQISIGLESQKVYTRNNPDLNYGFMRV